MSEGTGKIIAIAQSVLNGIAPSAIESKVDAWLDENITNPDSPPLDRSLSSSSSAAPADMVGDLKSAISALIQKEYQNINITNISGVEKLSGYSFGTSGSTLVSGSTNASYDSYYFYTDADTAMYFASAAPASPTYIALTVGYSPSKTWVTNEGQKQMSCTGATRKRKSESNLPVSASPMDVSSAIVIITVNASTTTTFFINNKIYLSDDVHIPLLQESGNSTEKAMSQKAVTDAISEAVNIKKPCLKYVSGSGGGYSTERVEIYIPTTNGYIKYNFVHSYSTSVNADIWRVDKAYLVNGSFVETKAITADGEWECAVKISERDDFSGGVIHGDEKYTNIYWLVDGKLTDITTLTDYTDFDDLRIIQTSNLYDPNDHTTVVAEHGSEHCFNASNRDDLIIRQSVKWKGAYSLGFSYLAMFPIAQSAVNKIYTDNGFAPATPVNGYYGYVNTATYYDSNGSVSAEFGINKYPTNNSVYNKSFSTQDNGGSNYYKGYYCVCGTDISVTNGTLWQSETKYKIIA